ncbi:protein lin-28 homolog A isoform X4 [Salmo salar]|uniref:Protein lin-28 homolog A n=1 Tax=Salmo salar TaxID=8030 RepID=A0A1S3Q078_SALSA|nr:protein lin-28 homolog A isoform X4 [Salmo salar]|eukprot:XP_014033337.1 PREDICTED: protein lin-28 homolog A-like isoform X5 [Salmo salar]
MFVKACLELQTGPNGSIGAFLCECMSYLSTMEISHFCDVFVKSKLHMEGFRSLKEGEAVEFTFKKSSKGLESVTVTGPGGAQCVGCEKTPKGQQKRRSKGDRCYNCGGPDHHAKECQLPPQPKKCHFCQSISHMVANCPIKAQQSSPGSQGIASSLRDEKEEQSHAPLLPRESSD